MRFEIDIHVCLSAIQLKSKCARLNLYCSS